MPPRPAAPLPAPPPDYSISILVRVCIALAYSSTYNPRKLGGFWYGPYLQTFAEIAQPYGGSIVVHPQFPVSVTAATVLEIKLRKLFAKANMDYGGMRTSDEGDSDTGGSSFNLSEVLGDLQVGLQPKNDSRYNRVAVNSQRKQEKERRAQRERRKLLIQERSRARALSGDRPGPNDPNLSGRTESGVADSDVINGIPDFVLAYVSTVTMPYSTKEDLLRSYNRRGGLRVFHYCCFVIAELKRSPQLRAGRWDTRAQLAAAQRALIFYCSIYFNRDTKAEKVVVIAGTGPFWTWATITRTDIPELAWTGKGVTKAKLREFSSKFSQKIFTLGTPESDRALTTISHTHIYPLTHDGHEGTPRYPEDPDLEPTDEELHGPEPEDLYLDVVPGERVGDEQWDNEDSVENDDEEGSG